MITAGGTIKWNELRLENDGKSARNEINLRTLRLLGEKRESELRVKLGTVHQSFI